MIQFNLKIYMYSDYLCYWIQIICSKNEVVKCIRAV